MSNTVTSPRELFNHDYRFANRCQTLPDWEPCTIPIRTRTFRLLQDTKEEREEETRSSVNARALKIKQAKLIGIKSDVQLAVRDGGRKRVEKCSDGMAALIVLLWNVPRGWETSPRNGLLSYSRSMDIIKWYFKAGRGAATYESWKSYEGILDTHNKDSQLRKEKNIKKVWIKTKVVISKEQLNG